MLTRAAVSKKRGFIAFTSLLIISVAVLAIALSISLLGIGEAQTSLTYKKGLEAKNYAFSCLEDGIYRLRASSSYTGSSLNLPSGSCTVNVGGSGSSRTLTSVGVVTGPPNYTQTLEVTVKRTGNSINILSWTQIP